MTDSVTIKIEGEERLKRALKNLADLDFLDPVMQSWAEGAKVALRQTSYPPKRAGQTYIRTGRLGEKWEVEPRAQQLVVGLFNATPYAGWVIGDPQAAVHKGRWWIAAQEVKDKYIDTLIKEMGDEVEKKYGRD